MRYCLNPTCQKPQNLDDRDHCQNCHSKLLLENLYYAIKPIGAGGMGRTFLALVEDSKKRVVIKQFFPQNFGTENSQKAAELFRQEADRLEQLGHHPQIPQLLDSFEQEGQQYLVQEYIQGQNLAQELAEKGPFSERKINQLLNDILPVLEF
ncbi:MAG: protein kinase domain-containing protein, partial [Microcoleaceae cyanobacterium]